VQNKINTTRFWLILIIIGVLCGGLGAIVLNEFLSPLNLGESLFEERTLIESAEELITSPIKPLEPTSPLFRIRTLLLLGVVVLAVVSFIYFFPIPGGGPPVAPPGNNIDLGILQGQNLAQGA